MTILAIHAGEVQYEEDAIDRILKLSTGSPWLISKKHTRASSLTLTRVSSAFAINEQRPSRHSSSPLWPGSGTDHMVGEVNAQLGFKKASRTSGVRVELTDKGLTYAPDRGLVEFTVPHFADYVRRTAT